MRAGLGITLALSLTFALAGLASLAGCKNREAVVPSLTGGDHALVLPTKDDVAMINGRRLPIGQFSALHELLGQPNPETTLWISLGAMALQEWIHGNHHLEVDSIQALTIARFAAGELPLAATGDLQKLLPFPLEQASLHDQIDRLLKTSRIVRNPHALSEFHEKAR